MRRRARGDPLAADNLLPCFPRLALFAAAVLLSIAFAPAAASGAVTHEFIGAFGPDGTSGTTFEHPGALAIDQTSGDLYAADLATGTVYKFGPEGESRSFSSLGSHELTGFTFNPFEAGVSQLAVNSTSHDFYVVNDAPTNTIAAFHANGEPAEFSALGSNEITGFSEACGVAVDENGDIYVGDFPNGLTVYAPTGELLSSDPVFSACNVAVDSSGNVYVNHWQNNVEKLTPRIYPVTAATEYTSEGTVDEGPAFGVAVEPTSGDLYVDRGDEVLQYDAGGTLLGSSARNGEGAVSGSEGLTVFGPEGLLYVSDLGSGQVKRYGPTVHQAPQVEEEWASAITATEATLNAEINPLGNPSSVYFEYGTEDCAASSCQATASAPLGSGEAPEVVSAHVGGLTPSSTYHFRAVVTSEGVAKFGADRTFTTYPAPLGSGFVLPDARGFELVSPVAKNDAEVGVPFPGGGFINGTVKPQRAAADGEAVAYASFTAFGSAGAAPAASYYLSRRSSAGWTTENITVPDATRALVGPIRGLAADLSFAAVVAQGEPLAPGAVAGIQNLYLRDDETGALQALTTETPSFVSSPDEFCVNYVGASPDGNHVIFMANGGLTPNAPPPAAPGATYLYEWSAGAGVELVGILPDETPATPTLFDGFGAGPDRCSIDFAPITLNALSNDGSRVFWTHNTNGFSPELFARVGGSRTIQLDANAGGPDEGGGGEFLAASADGSRAFFVDGRRLVPGATEGDLYEYDLESEELNDLTEGAEPSRVQGLLGASEDGSTLYFVAQGALAAGAVAGEPNLYLWHEGAIHLVATVSEEDSGDWSSNYRVHSAAVSPDGSHLAFTSTAPLTGFDNRIVGRPACRLDFEGQPTGGRGCSEVYLFDAANEKLVCVSCNPSGSNPLGPPREAALNDLPPFATPFEQPRYLSAGGRRLFFESYESLLPRDTNSKKDIYEFERPGTGGCSLTDPAYRGSVNGCLYLITPGTAGDETYFLDASSSGNDVFFSTRQQLVPADRDQRFDVYDARVGGGFPPPPESPPPCTGEGCRPSGAATQESGGAPASSTFVGPGNARPRECRHGKVRRHGHCVRRRHRHRHRHHSRKGRGSR